MTVSKAREAFVNGSRAFDDIRELVGDALTNRARAATGTMAYVYVYVADLTDTDVVYSVSDDLWQCSYSIADDGAVTLGEPARVVRTYVPAPASTANEPAEPGDLGASELGPDDPDISADSDLIGMGESQRVRTAGRVIEAKGTDADGGRIFRVRIVEYGDSQNGRRYPAAVMREAVGLYEGAKAYDHHRTLEELQTSTVQGLIGFYRDTEAEDDGLYGDLHLLPGATHVAESLDASLAAQEAGLEPIVGISHDVMAHFKPIVDGGRRLQEATSIASVSSADVVAKPSAGGKAVRAVAGGEPSEPTEGETDVATTADVLAALKEATDEDLAGVGLARATKTTESTAPAGPATRATEGAPESAREAELPKGSFLGKLMIERKVTEAELPASAAEAVATALPERIRESDVDAQIAAIKSAFGIIERSELAPTIGSAQVTQESLDKKKAALDRFFEGDFSGYRSFKQAYLDISGRAPRSYFDEDLNRTIMRESIGATLYDSGDRATESMSSGTWNLVLGDSVTRRLVAEYNQPDLQTWRSIVSSFVPIADFRTQRIDRIGGYGTLPTVAQGAPYQPLTSPANEEVTYSITKRGGTEDITLEMIANDDVRAISKIPTKLGLAAAQTLYRFVWDFVTTAAGTATTSGGSTTYDSSSLFTSGHSNFVNSANGSALSQSALSAGRLLMRSQTAYGDTADFIAPLPRFLVVVNDIEELAWQLCTSAVALPTAANTPPQSTGAANTPNIHQGLTPIVLDYVANATSTTAWWLVADPGRIPTIEVGFYQGQQDPQLFTQSDPSVGSMFNSDKLTFKIRHMYGGSILDHRGFVKGNV